MNTVANEDHGLNFDDFQTALMMVLMGTGLVLTSIQLLLHHKQQLLPMFRVRIPPSIYYITAYLTALTVLTAVPWMYQSLPCAAWAIPSIFAITGFLVHVLERIFMQYVFLNIGIDGINLYGTFHHDDELSKKEPQLASGAVHEGDSLIQPDSDEDEDAPVAGGKSRKKNITVKYSSTHEEAEGSLSPTFQERVDEFLFKNRGRFHMGSFSVSKKLALVITCLVSLAGMLSYSFLHRHSLKDEFHTDSCQSSLSMIFLYQSIVFLLSGFALLSFLVTLLTGAKGRSRDKFFLRDEHLKHCVLIVWTGIYLMVQAVAPNLLSKIFDRPMLVTYGVHFVILPQLFIWFMLGNISRKISRFMDISVDRYSHPGQSTE
eukprot:TRINITY_DN5892_c0_g1_i2.p1 TRINITY_DN5892_c0_g1~~TRINITY_DN5892_c0_g1_i2.p1  ORF type:complete len:374 (-),score=65.04 TRINITY_DN5892_c0_g1_i2:48-1169(-)